MFGARVCAYSGRMDAKTRASAPAAVATAALATVFLVEDSEVIRERLLYMLGEVPGTEVVGHAETADSAVAQIAAIRPAVVVLDVKLKESSGMQVLRVIKQQMPRIVVIVLTNYASPVFRKRYEEAGADYFLDKSNEFEVIRTILMQHCLGNC